MRLFKRPSTSPQLVSATPISQDEAASRTEAAENAVHEASAKVEEAQCTPKANSDVDSATKTSMPAPSSSFSAKGISTWGRKVGRRWDQLKRSDSSELLSVSGRRRRWSPNRKSLCDTSEDKDKSRTEGSSAASLTKPKRISRVESIRNLFRASDRGSSGSINVDSGRSVTIEEEDDVDSLNYYAMDKALSEGALRNVAQFRISEDSRTDSLNEKKKQLSQSIQSFQEQQRVFDYILKNQEILKTQEGMSFARDTLDKVQNVLQSGASGNADPASGNVELNKSDASTQTLEAARSNVKRNLFSVRTNSGDNERNEQRRSFIGSGLEDLMCTLRLGCDESGYDSDSTRAGADSPDSEKAVASMLKRRSFSITSDDYQGIDLSLPVSTPKKKDAATTVTTSSSGPSDPCGESLNGDCGSSVFDESVRTDTTLMSDDDNDTDSCDEDTFADFPDFRFNACFSPRASTTTARPTCNGTPRKTAATASENLLASRDLQRTPIKRTNLLNEDAMPLAQRVRLQNLQKENRRTQVSAKGRRVSNASVLNLLDNAASPSKDSPPASKIRTPGASSCVQYYSPKRSRSKLELDGTDAVDGVTMHPVKRPVFAAPPPPPPPPASATKTLVRRELKTMKLLVEKAGSLGISVEKREAVRPFYVVSRLEAGGEAAKSKQIRVGDEVVRVCGRRLRGMSIAEARNALKNCVGSVELQIAREPTFNFDGELGDTWGEPIVRTRSDNAVWTLPEPAVGAGDDTIDACRTEGDETPKNCRIVGALTKDGKSVSMHAMPVSGHESDAKSKVTGMRKFQVMRKRNSMPAARPRRATSLSMDLLTVTLEKGATKKLGFSIVGGSDSNKGSMGIFVKDVMEGGQAAEEGTLRAGDEILAINGQTMDGVTHAKALQHFKAARPGKLILHVGRRDPTHKRLLTKR